MAEIETKKCPGCSNTVAARVSYYPYCGFHFPAEQSVPAASVSEKPSGYHQYKSIVLCVLAVVCLIIGVTRLTCNKYRYLTEHYSTCMEKYEENSQTAKSFSSGFFRSSYEFLASSYKDMAEKDMKEIWKYRIIALLFCCGSVMLGIFAYRSLKRTKALPDLIPCPGCGKELPNKPGFCPFCGSELNAANPSGPAGKAVLKSRLIWIIPGILIAVVCIIWIVSDRNSAKQTHICDSYSEDWADVSSYTPKTGNEGALAKAKSYLSHSAFSYEGLVEQLEYEGYSESEAEYGADYCGADWNEQALLKAKSYLSHNAFSYESLIEQLEFEGFTSLQAQYGADLCGADWNEQAVKKAQSYLRTKSDWTKSELQDQLEFEGFTSVQAKYGVDHCGNW